MTAFGDHLRFYRSRVPMTQEELSDRTGVSVRAISDMERGRARTPQRRTVALLAAGLGLTGEEADEFARLARTGRHSPAASTTTPTLPPVLTELTGRDDERQILDGFARDAESSSLLQIAVIHGPPGAGKTALAVDAGHRLADRFADGCLFLDLRGMDDEPLPPERAAHRLLRGFGVDERQIPADPDDKLALYHSVLHDRAVLLVLDNAANEAQVRPLLATSPGTLVVVTSRNTLTGLDARHRLALGLLCLDRSVALLRVVAGEQRIAAEPKAAARVAELCGGVPLALLIAGHRLAGRPQWTIVHLADQLADERRRLSVLTAGDLQVRTAFEISYLHLGPAAATLFRRLALVPGADTSVELAAVVTGQPEELAKAALEELADASLLGISDTPGRYTQHDLLRVFATERLQLDEDTAVVRAASERLRHWLLAVATKAAQFFDHDRAGEPVPIDGPDPVRDRESADRWLAREQWPSAVAQGEWEPVLKLAQSMHWYSDLRGTGALWREVYGAGARAAQELGDPLAEAQQLNYLSWALYSLCGQLDDALTVHERAAAKAREANDLLALAWSEYYGAAIRWRRGRHDEAVAGLRTAADLFEHAGYSTGRFLAIAMLGTQLQRLGRFEEAVAAHRHCVAHYRAEAAAPGNDELLAMVLTRYAESLTAAGDVLPAFDLLDEAESLFRRHDVTMAVARVWQLRGNALIRAGRWREATAQLVSALDAARSAEARIDILVRLADVADECDDSALAREHRIRALAECAAFNTPTVRGVAEKLEAALNA